MKNNEKRIRILSYFWSKYTQLLYSSSLICIVLSFALSGKVGVALLAIGSGILITTLVTSILNYHIQEDIRKEFTIIGNSVESSISRIFPNRKKARVHINNDFHTAKSNIDVLAVAGTDLFHSDCPLINLLSDMCIKKTNITVRIMLLDPRSYTGIERAQIENVKYINGSQLLDYPNSTLVNHILTSLMMLGNILRALENNGDDGKGSGLKLEVRTYIQMPTMQIVNIDNKTYVEQYHSGISKIEKLSIIDKCLGKKVPVLEFSSYSIPGEIWNDYFEYLWDSSSKLVVTPCFHDTVRQYILAHWKEIDNDYKEYTAKYFQPLG